MRSIATETNAGITFTFPGQGSYSYALLRELFTSYLQTEPYFNCAHEISRELLNGDFLSLVTTESEQEHNERLSASPDLDQIGIYLSEVLVARILMESGVKPALLVGHSFGELAALATAGVYSIETGLRIVCERVMALQSNARLGAMAAISCDPERATQYLKEFGNSSIEISVINHSKQTVLSGQPSALKQLETILNRHGVSLTFIKSRYPFHSSLLREAVEPFRRSLEAHHFKPASVPVYLCSEAMLYSPGSDLVQILSSQFVRPLNFRDVVRTLYRSEYRTFIECGAGNIVSKLLSQSLGAQASDIQSLAVIESEGTLRQGLLKLLELGFGEREKTTNERATGRESYRELLRRMSGVVNDMSRVLDDACSLLDRESLQTAPAPETSVKPNVATSKPVVPQTALSQPPSPNGSAPRMVSIHEKCFETPVAIVSLGCVLPGARNPEQYWSNILNGVSGITNLADVDPSAARDFLAGNDNGQIKITPDKTYTLLHGSIADVPYDPPLLSPAYTEEEFNALTKGQKLLALALAQSISGVKNSISGPTKVQSILGATADGSEEYDDALFLESLQTLLDTLDEPENLRRAVSEALEDISGYRKDDARKLTQHKLYSAVIERLLGSSTPIYVIDAACASSLYSIYLGMKALEDLECDVVFAGGVFAPGPANNTLFAQFRGLAHRASRPFDVAAEGVVFGDGAGIVVLKRLPDALAAGDRIHAVIRGIGLSSDGKSPSINVPQVKGQVLAIQNACRRSGIDVNTIQYLEAHATATTVGDAVEFKAIKDFLKRDAGSPPIELGSVKALIGHTGWAAGAASLIKICKAIEARVIPQQYNYDSPSSEIDLAHSQFTISRTTHSWPDNVPGYPRRAAINGFGFGGTNAHLQIEEFHDAYHRELCAQLKNERRVPDSLAVIGVGSLFPRADGSMGDDPSPALRFQRESLRLPAKKMLLPDVTDHMDTSQYLAALAAEKAVGSIPEVWTRFKSAMAVVLGIESKTERGIRANERIFIDRLLRRANEYNGKLPKADLQRIVDKLVERIRARNLASGPYTLPGLMPNVTAGRIANLFDLNGPNIVIDMGDRSLEQSLFVGRQLLAHGDCKIVLAGGINANTAEQSDEAEAGLVLALTTLDVARNENLPVISVLRFESNDQISEAEVSQGNTTPNYKGAQGAPDLLKAIQQSSEKRSRFAFKQHGKNVFADRRLVFEPPSSPARQPSTSIESSTYAYVQGTPIRCYTPQLIPAKASGDATSLEGRKILFLTDDPELWLVLERSGALAPFNYKVTCVADAQLANSLPIDLTSDQSVQCSLSGWPPFEFETLIAIKHLADRSADAVLVNGKEFGWLDLLFAVCRENYERLKTKNVSIVTLCQDAYKGGQLDPFTGLISGFMKSLSRELDGPLCRAINTDEVNLYKSLRQVEMELGQQESEVEVCYREGVRSIFTLSPIENLTQDDQPFLNSDSVVIATGGARGVTAVLAEELLSRFGCRVIALGRTDPSSFAAEFLDVDERSFQNHESQFYKQQLAQNNGKKITELKREYLACRAANEVWQVTKRLRAISERFEYRTVDITSEPAIDQLVEEIYRQYGRVDLVLHGAGIQVSCALNKKSLSDFRGIIGAKLGGLSNLYKACQKYGPDSRTHFHILTSAFSYMGNDGQPDYGAANEAMARIAASMNSRQETYWSSMAWLGWAGIGMTRDSQFAALAAARGLRGVTKEEGQQIFSLLMNGRPATPINVLLAEGEIDYYKVAIQHASAKVSAPTASRKNLRREIVIERDITIQDAPYLLNHLVDGVPTVPGALIIDFVAQAAFELRPELKIIAFEEAFFRKFIKVFKNRKTQFRIESSIVSEDDQQTVLKVRILSDFVHRSGLVLQKNILQHESLVRMSSAPLQVPKVLHLNGNEGRRSIDPYAIEGAPISLSGPFDAIRNLVIGRKHRRADFCFGDLNARAESQAMLSKVVLMDSLMRFGVIQISTESLLPVFVPEACDVMRVYFDFANFDVSKLAGTLTLTGANPRTDGEILEMGPVAVVDAHGNTLLEVDRGVCRRFGEVRNGYVLSRSA